MRYHCAAAPSRRHDLAAPFQQVPDAGPFRIASVLCVMEWAAYFGVFVSLTLYLTRVAGFTDVEAGWVAGVFGLLACVLPVAAGTWVDRVGYRRALIVAYVLLATGYGALAAVPGRASTLAALALVVAGGSVTRTAIMATAATTSDSAGRARAYSILMQMINVGCFIGKAVARPIRVGLGVEYSGAWAAAATLLALGTVVLFYRDAAPARALASGGLSVAWKGLGRVMRNRRFLGAIMVAGVFWAVQVQLYAVMPKYLTRLVGETASPEWYANVNPLVVILLIVPVTRATRGMSPRASMAIALALVALS